MDAKVGSGIPTSTPGNPRDNRPAAVDIPFLENIPSGILIGAAFCVSAVALWIILLLVVCLQKSKKKAMADAEMSSGRWSQGELVRTAKVETDIPKLLNFIPGDLCDMSTTDISWGQKDPTQLCVSQTTFKGEKNPFNHQFSDFVSSDGGEVLSPGSDVSVTVPRNTIPQGRIQQIYVNVAENDDGLFLPDQQNRASPVVECIAPGLKTLPLPVMVNIPLENCTGGATVYWTHDLSGNQNTWMTVPPEQQDSGVQQMMCYRMDQNSISIELIISRPLPATSVISRSHVRCARNARQ